ncbi:MAG: hypothetical protein JNL32_06440 [Candidatus Kapabacteria bacterium]|nr:hypothetical protein [Candidatus Kapabacteria bacterium]
MFKRNISLSLNAVFSITALTTLLLLVSTLSLARTDWVVFISKCADVSTLWLCIGLITLYFQGRRFNTYETISRNPVAVAVFTGSIFIATALCIAR